MIRIASYHNYRNPFGRGLIVMPLIWISIQTSFCQDLAKTRSLVEQRRWQEARRSIEQTLSRSEMKGHVEAWYLKAKVCSALASDTSSKSPTTEFAHQSLSALQKALSIDRSEAEALLARDDYKPLYDLYASGMVNGKILYGKARYRESSETFEEVGRVGEFIHSQGWGLQAFDTTLTLWKALASAKSGRPDLAKGHLNLLSEAGVQGIPEYAVVYRWLTRHAYENGDASAYSIHRQRGLTRYPDDTYLCLIELDRLLDLGDSDGLIPMLDSLSNRYPDSYELALQCADQLFETAHSFDRKSRNRLSVAKSVKADSMHSPTTHPESVYWAKCDRIALLYNRCLELKAKSREPVERLGRHFYNEALILDSSKRQQPWPEAVLAGMEDRIRSSKKKGAKHLEETLGRFDGGEWRFSDLEEYRSVLKMLAFCHTGIDARKADAFFARLEELDRGGNPPVRTGKPATPNPARKD